MLPTIFETAPINYISPRISNDDNLLVPSPSFFKELSSSRKKRIGKSNNKMCGGEITVEDDKVYIPTRRVFDDNDDDDNNESSSMTTNINTVLQIDLDDIPDLPFDCPPDIMISSSEQEELDDDDADDDIGVSVKNDINFVPRSRPRPLLRSSTTPTDTSLSLLQRQQQHNDEVRKQARASLLYSSSSGSPRSVRCSNLSV